MCQRAICPTCRKATYQGCGNHIEQVLAGVPADQRCACGPLNGRRARAAAPKAPAHGQPKGGWWSRLVDWAKGPA